MTVSQQLIQDMKDAMRAREAMQLESIRFILSKVKNFEIDKPNREPATDDEIQQIVRKLVKDTQEAIAQYQTGGRQDLVDSETAKIAVYKNYLPQQLSDDEVRALIISAKTANPDLAQGPLIGQVLKAAQGKTDGATIGRLLRE